MNIFENLLSFDNIVSNCLIMSLCNKLSKKRDVPILKFFSSRIVPSVFIGHGTPLFLKCEKNQVSFCILLYLRCSNLTGSPHPAHKYLKMPLF